MAPRLGLGSSVSADTASPLFGAPLFFDTYPAAYAAYSLRKLSSTYTGICCRLRRYDDSVNTKEADLHFDSRGAISLNSLVNNFSASSAAINLGEWTAASGYADADSLGSVASAAVTNWKDQSGNGRDAVQGTAAEQPPLVSSGVLESENGKVAMGSGNDFLLYDSASAIAQPTTYIGVVQTDVITSSDYWIYNSRSGENQTLAVVSSDYRMHADDWVGTATADTDQHLWFALFNGASSLLHIDSGSNIAGGDPGDYAQTGLAIGGNYLGGSSWRGTIQEIIYYASDQSGSRAGMESDVNAYYSIY